MGDGQFFTAQVIGAGGFETKVALCGLRTSLPGDEKGLVWFMQKTISIMDILAVLRKKWGVLFVSTLLGATAFVLVSIFMLPKIYTSSVSLYVNNGKIVANSSDVQLGDINAATRLVDTYIVVLTNESVLEQAAQRVGESVTPAQLRSAISMNSVNQTEVLQISAKTTDPELSAKICNVMSEIAPEALQRVVKAGSVETLGAAKPATSPSSPNVSRNGAVGGVMGLLLSAIICLLVSFLDTRIKGEEDLKEYVDLPVLGEIPSFESKGGSSRGR